MITRCGVYLDGVTRGSTTDGVSCGLLPAGEMSAISPLGRCTSEDLQHHTFLPENEKAISVALLALLPSAL